MKLISPVIFSFVAAWSFTSVYTPAGTGTALFQPQNYTKNTTESLLWSKWHENVTTYPKETQKHLQTIWSIRIEGHTHSISRFFGSGFGFVFLWLPSMLSLLRKFHWTIHFLFWCNRRKIRLLQNVLASLVITYFVCCDLLRLPLYVIFWNYFCPVHTLGAPLFQRELPLLKVVLRTLTMQANS